MEKVVVVVEKVAVALKQVVLVLKLVVPMVVEVEVVALKKVQCLWSAVAVLQLLVDCLYRLILL